MRQSSFVVAALSALALSGEEARSDTRRLDDISPFQVSRLGPSHRYERDLFELKPPASNTAPVSPSPQHECGFTRQVERLAEKLGDDLFVVLKISQLPPDQHGAQLAQLRSTHPHAFQVLRDEGLVVLSDAPTPTTEWFRITFGIAAMGAGALYTVARMRGWDPSTKGPYKS